jgi:signal transduction histidine kinase
MNEADQGLHFPDGPRAELDDALSDLMSAAQRVLATQGRLRSLLGATQAIVEQTDLPQILRRIVEVGTELVGARYGALGVVSPDGHLEQFIHVGMPAATAESIGHLPEGYGLLGALIQDPRPIRLEHLGRDPRSSGFPLGHPEMESFLGVPIRVRGEVFGNIYVTEGASGTFGEDDQELLIALAATAGIVIDNARLLEETRRRQRWSVAAAEITAILVAEDSVDSLGSLAERVVALADADLVAVVLPASPGALIVDTARGIFAPGVTGLTFSAEGSVTGRAMESGQPVLADTSGNSSTDRTHPFPSGPCMAIPLVASGQSHGVLAIARAAGRRGFTPSDMDMATDFAGQASLAMALAQGRTARLRLTLLEERGRIARDLHDHVIQRLFSAGLALQSLGSTMRDHMMRSRIDDTVKALDDSIGEIRTAIFALVSPRSGDHTSVRHRIIDVISEVSPLFSSPPRVKFTGPIDLLVSDELADNLVAVVREALTNVGKHAHASETVVSVAATDEDVVVDVIDDGVGVSEGHRTSGIGNLRTRAQHWGGEFTVRAREGGGTALRWKALITDEHEVVK